MGEGAIDVTANLASLAGEGWRTSHVKLSCFAEAGADMESMDVPLMFMVEGQLEIQIASAELAANPGNAGCTL
jgi:beta-glucosidase